MTSVADSIGIRSHRIRRNVGTLVQCIASALTAAGSLQTKPHYQSETEALCKLN
jgi:hypothetical protein